MRNGAADYIGGYREPEKRIEEKNARKFSIHNTPPTSREVERDRGNVPKERKRLAKNWCTGKKDESNIEDNNLMTITLLLGFVW